LFTLNEEAALDSLRQHVARGTLLSPQWFAVSGGGALAGAPNAVLLEAARSRGVAVAPSVINRDFSAQAAAAVLRSAPARSRLVSQLTAKARQYGFRGYVIDFENLPADPATRKRFTQWMGELRAAFSPARLSLIVALPPPTTRQRQALDYQAIGRLADRVVLMAYDQHGRFNDPGPIAGYEWVETALADIGALIPAHKLLLGIAFYHRNWGGAEATSGTYNEAVALGRENRAEWRWHPEYRAHWFDFMERGHRHTVWIEDAASVAEKLALARRFGLAGVAGWRLGQEDPRVWLLLQEFQR
jgi:spore germination protein YaaH